MRNRNVGFLIMGVAIIIVAIIFIFNSALKDIVSATCSHGPSCSMYKTISTQTYLSLAIAGIIFIIGLFFIFVKEKEKIIIKKEKLKEKSVSLEGLEPREKEIIKMLLKEKAVFQRTLMERLNIGKVETTRLLDKLEAKQLIERKRRGMNNVVVLKS